ncbi:MAG: MCE family protein [Aeromicrobium erythreum]
MKLDKESLSALVKLAVFLVVTGAATALLMMTMSNIQLGGSREYKALFTDATGVTKGDDVRIAGVSVGAVKSVKVVERDKAEVTFSVRSQTPLTQDTTVQIRFRNLVGQRYLALAKNAEGSTATQRPGSTIPLDRTTEALDLNALLNGFKPVFQALSPDDTNKLAFEIVQTLQGEGGNVENLLARTASLTRTLADRDELIGDVVTNLSETLDTIGSRDRQLTRTIDTLQQFITGLKDDRGAILDSIDGVSQLSDETASLLVQGRPDLTKDVKQLNRLTKNLSKPKNLDTVEDAVQILPIKLSKLGTLASTGGLFNFYACTLDVRIEDLPEALQQVLAPLTKVKTGGSRCLGEG